MNSPMLGERVCSMIKKLNIAEVARKIGLKDVLTFRPLGKEAKAIIISEVEALEADDLIEMNFDGIRTCDVSFVDEMIIEVKLYIKNKNNVLLFLTNLSDDIFDNLEAALALREQKSKIKTQILIKKYNSYDFAGALEQNLKETFNQLVSRNEITARDIAASFKLEINSASNRLKKIYDAGLCLRKEIIDEHGKQHVYFLPR